jgi:integrase
VRTSVPRQDRITVELAGERYIEHLESVKRRKPTTITDYRAILRRHLAPFTAGRTVGAVDGALIRSYISAKLREGLSAKTVRNHVVFAHGLFGHAVARGWASVNPVDRRDLPAAGGANPNIRYLRAEELEALYRAVPDDDLGPTERVLYMTGAMAGLRLGELIGLSWRHIDWSAGVIRVRRSFTHGAWSTPKSRTSSRAVPLADRLAGELERHYQRSAFGHDDDLVFAHPVLGTVLDGSKLRKRFRAALERAEVRRVRLHDLRHSFGTAMAAAGTPMRALMEYMGHATIQTTLIYADYSPDPSGGVEHANRAFAVRGSTRGSKVSETEVTSEHPEPL